MDIWDRLLDEAIAKASKPKPNPQVKLPKPLPAKEDIDPFPVTEDEISQQVRIHEEQVAAKHQEHAIAVLEYDSDEDFNSDLGSVQWPHEVLMGQAGTGKSYTLRERIQKDPTYGLLCATTGIAAIHLSTERNQVTTINSALKYYNTASLQEKLDRGELVHRIRGLAENYRRIILDEMSMFGKQQFDILHYALVEANHSEKVKEAGGIGLLLVGDFLQLPPVKDTYLFESSHWQPYSEHIEVLTTNYRQVDTRFREALKWARKGEGRRLSQALYGHPEITIASRVDKFFPGTTIYASNDEVAEHNETRLQALLKAGRKMRTINSVRWGKPQPEWKEIPGEFEVCQDAYVMCLVNGPDLVYANGSKGYVQDIYLTPTPVIEIELEAIGDRPAMTVEIQMMTRRNEEPYKEAIHGPIESKDTRAEWEAKHGGQPDLAGYQKYLQLLTLKHRIPGRPYYNYVTDKMVIGEVTFMPLRLAYATTVHKAQGLTLDKVQIDFAGSGKSQYLLRQAGMVYVALSRVRSPEGLRIVGNANDFAAKTNVHRKVLPWA